MVEVTRKDLDVLFQKGLEKGIEKGVQMAFAELEKRFPEAVLRIKATLTTKEWQALKGGKDV